MTNEPPKRRRWLQFSLKRLLIAVLVLSLPLSWFAVNMKRARRQRKTVDAIERLGGHVTYDWEIAAMRGRQSPYPDWLVGLLGEDFLFDVVRTEFPSGFARDEATCWKELVNIKWLCLDNTEITDAELVHLKGLKHLVYVGLKGTQITDAGLEHLERITGLRTLTLDRTKITDAGLEHLKRMTKLGYLNLSGTQINDAGLVHLKALTSLRRLDLEGTQVTDAGVKHLEGLTILTLAGPEITDAAIDHLEGLSNLAFLFLFSTSVTPEGVKRLREALPNCAIDYRTSP